MKVTLGKEGLSKTMQAPFSLTTTCCRCGSVARIAFVAHECGGGKGPFVYQMHRNNPPEGMWFHDACAVAVYLCKSCLEPTAHWNQA
jgi:hypothetical protein